MKSVEVVVGSKQVGLGFVVPYSHDHGLQYYVSATGIKGRAVVYKVPVYRVQVTGGSSYSAIRFGLRRRGFGQGPSRRVSGLHRNPRRWVE